MNLGGGKIYRPKNLGPEFVVILNQWCYGPLHSVRNIPDTYSCVINKLSPTANVKAPTATKQIAAVNVQTSAVTKQTSATNVQTSGAIKQIHTATIQKPTTTKQTSAVNVQALATTKQTSAVTVQAPLSSSRCPLLLPAPPASHPQTRHSWASLPLTSHLPAFALPCQQASPHPLLWEIARLENQERQFPKAKLGRNCCPIWEPTKWGMD
ncbi:hypothetical protein DSO57_1011841 [Entomophthora muscae]|uniref:Uncharacterized protein n=1 Tax=Entomophthora muscae TaxID=34485 RepID=A0ACC2RKX9_9FUNG|nr:hypothetical protein DSO57_1011841 [Entomophthora muscae]